MIRTLAAIFVSATCSVPVLAGQVVVSASSSSPTMDKAAVQAIYLGRTPNIGGAPAVVVFQGGALRAEFETKVVGRSGAQLKSHWSRLVFTGRSKAPIEVAGDAAVANAVASTPGAIGFVSDGPVDPRLKVVFDF